MLSNQPPLLSLAMAASRSPRLKFDTRSVLDGFDCSFKFEPIVLQLLLCRERSDRKQATASSARQGKILKRHSRMNTAISPPPLKMHAPRILNVLLNDRQQLVHH